MKLSKDDIEQINDLCRTNTVITAKSLFNTLKYIDSRGNEVVYMHNEGYIKINDDGQIIPKEATYRMYTPSLKLHCVAVVDGVGVHGEEYNVAFARVDDILWNYDEFRNRSNRSEFKLVKPEDKVVIVHTNHGDDGDSIVYLDHIKLRHDIERGVYDNVNN